MEQEPSVEEMLAKMGIGRDGKPIEKPAIKWMKEKYPGLFPVWPSKK